jgi:2-polyprenyl-3-methyl-5-hydroxy-6-metoxy-1,4-benzoquinol methylase
VGQDEPDRGEERALAPPSPRGVQVGPGHYDFERYDDAERWMSYWHQIRAVLAVRPRTVLEIGPGSGVLRSYLLGRGVDVKTLDLDPERRPDYVADLTRLDETLPAGLQFDAICAFQVLEHLPFEELEPVLANLARRSRRDVFISLPYRGWRLRLAFWSGDWSFSIGHKFMFPWVAKRCPEHYWELGKGYSARRITRILARHFEVVSRGFIRENPYHYLWALRVPGADQPATS